MKRLATLTITIFALLLSAFVFTPQAGAQDPHRTGICHATEADKNVFVYISPSNPSIDTHLGHLGVEGSDRVATEAEFQAGQCVPTVVPTPTPVTPTPVTPTATDVPPTATATDVPPTATATDVPPTATATDVPATATATATTVPGQPSPTDVPATATATDAPKEPTKAPAEPTKAAAPVTSLPSTGSDGGASGGGQGLILLAAATATLMAGAGVILTNHARGRHQR